MPDKLETNARRIFRESPERDATGNTQGGPLLIIGGAEDHDNSCDILKAFIQLSGRAKARLAVITAATEHPDQVGQAYDKVFRRLGCSHVYIVCVDSRSDAASPENLSVL